MAPGEKQEQVKCMVKNCQKPLKPGDEVRVGTKIFCKNCAIFYFKDLIGV
nr:hypothetical protein [Candidatus Sigynarchaeota archaeon]